MGQGFCFMCGLPYVAYGGGDEGQNFFSCLQWGSHFCSLSKISLFLRRPFFFGFGGWARQISPPPPRPPTGALPWLSKPPRVGPTVFECNRCALAHGLRALSHGPCVWPWPAPVHNSGQLSIGGNRGHQYPVTPNRRICWGPLLSHDPGTPRHCPYSPPDEHSGVTQKGDDRMYDLISLFVRDCLRDHVPATGRPWCTRIVWPPTKSGLSLCAGPVSHRFAQCRFKCVFKAIAFQGLVDCTACAPRAFGGQCLGCSRGPPIPLRMSWSAVRCRKAHGGSARR